MFLMIWKFVYGLHSRISQTASLRFKKRQYLHGKPQLLSYINYKQHLKSLTFLNCTCVLLAVNIMALCLI